MTQPSNSLPDLSHLRLPDNLTRRGPEPPALSDDLLNVIKTAITGHPRSQQKTIGPSELGTPCSRRLGYKLSGVEEVNQRGTPWKPTVGTAVHSWLEEAVILANAKDPVRENGHTRWLVEHRVNVGEVNGQPVIGSCDLYDQVTRTVLDWKIVGVTSLRRYRSKGPGQQYRTQAHLYGRGCIRRGLLVDHVAIFFLPQNGELADGYFWTEPYDEQMALDALLRADSAISLINTLGAGAVAVLPTADAFCDYCPWFLPASTELKEACPGHSEASTPIPTQPDRAQPERTLT